MRKPPTSSKRRKPSPKRSPSPVRKPERSNSKSGKRKTPTRIARPRTPPKAQTSDEDYTDNEVVIILVCQSNKIIKKEQEPDSLDVGVNIISADDFIEDALSLIPKEL